MWRAFSISIGLGVPFLALAVLLAAGRFNFWVFLGTAAIAVFTLPAALVGLLIVYAFRRDRPDSHPWLGHAAGILAAWCVGAILLVPAYLGGTRLIPWRVKRAMAATTPIIATLEAHRREHGAYPDEVELPSLIAAWGGYETHDDGQVFSIHIDDHRSLFGWSSWRYESGRGEWHHEDD